MDGPIGMGRLHLFGDLVDHVRRGVVDDGVNGVEAQPVEVVFLQPVERVVNGEGAQERRVSAVVVEAGAPGGLVALGEDRAEEREVIPLGTEVIVDDVEQHLDPVAVRRVHEQLQVLRPAVGGVGGEGQHAVVAPVAPAGEGGDRHEFDGGDAEGGEVVELLDRRGEGARWREGADVEFVEDGSPARPARASWNPTRRRSGSITSLQRARPPAGSARRGRGPPRRRAAVAVSRPRLQAVHHPRVPCSRRHRLPW